jgi:hypothetical protein
MTKCQIHVWAWNEANTPFRSIFFNIYVLIDINKHMKHTTTNQTSRNGAMEATRWAENRSCAEKLSGNPFTEFQLWAEFHSRERIPLVQGHTIRTRSTSRLLRRRFSS